MSCLLLAQKPRHRALSLEQRRQGPATGVEMKRKGKLTFLCCGNMAAGQSTLSNELSEREDTMLLVLACHRCNRRGLGLPDQRRRRGGRSNQGVQRCLARARMTFAVGLTNRSSGRVNDNFARHVVCVLAAQRER